MKRILFLFVFILNISVFAQPRGERAKQFYSGPKPIYIEAHLIPSDSIHICYISYKVPYSNLVFVKEGIVFSSGITFGIEATGQEGVIARESTHDKVELTDYDETNSSQKFLEGIVKFRFNNHTATINPLIELDNTDSQVPLRPFKMEVEEYKPIVVKIDKDCKDSHGYSLVNFENSIPYDDENHKLLLPIYDTELEKIKVSISQNEKIVIEKELSKNATLSIELDKCNEKIAVVNNPLNKPANIFVLDQFTYLLEEGPVEISIFNEDNKEIHNSELYVNWIDKPAPLMNPKFAFGLLELMESEDYLDDIYDKSDGEYERAISLFWEKYDPNKKTKFNQLMYEFYSRAEKAIREYAAKGNRDRFGRLTDRAKVFIKYGKPSEVERFYSDKDEITEIWKYISPKAEFVFIDATGLGNYKLVN